MLAIRSPKIKVDAFFTTRSLPVAKRPQDPDLNKFKRLQLKNNKQVSKRFPFDSKYVGKHSLAQELIERDQNCEELEFSEKDRFCFEVLVKINR